MHKITKNPSAALIASQLSGFMSVADVKAYAGEVEPIIRKFVERGPYRMLIDVTDCPIQAQVVVCEFQRHVSRVPRAQRLAVVTGSSMVRMQVRRIMDGPNMAMFDDREAALSWLSQSAVHTH